MWDPMWCVRLAEIRSSCQTCLPQAGWAEAEDEGPVLSGPPLRQAGGAVSLSQSLPVLMGK